MSVNSDQPILASSWIIGLFVTSSNDKLNNYTFYGDAKYPTAIKLSNDMSGDDFQNIVKPQLRGIAISPELTGSGSGQSNHLEMMPLAETSRKRGMRFHRPVDHIHMFKLAELLCSKYNTEAQLHDNMPTECLLTQVIISLKAGMDSIMKINDAKVNSVGELRDGFGKLAKEILSLMIDKSFIAKELFESLNSIHSERRVMGWLFLYLVIQTSNVRLSFHGGSISLLYREILFIGGFDVSINKLPAVEYVVEKDKGDCRSLHDFVLSLESMSQMEKCRMGVSVLKNMNANVLDGVRE